MRIIVGKGPAMHAAVAVFLFFFFFFFFGGGGGAFVLTNGVLPGSETVKFLFFGLFL